jgi:hypothetical protein
MAEMVPVEFWGWVIAEVKKENPAVTFIAEIYNPFEYRNYINIGKFDYLYDKVGCTTRCGGSSKATEVLRILRASGSMSRAISASICSGFSKTMTSSASLHAILREIRGRHCPAWY